MIEQEVVDFKRKLIDQQKVGLVLDIDETLSNTAVYWVKQLQERFGNEENLTAQEVVAKYRYTQHVPYWQTIEVLEWMERARENNAFQEEIPIIENANHIVQQIDKIIPIVGYLTIRPRSVIEGTKAWLRSHDFPDVDVITRPLGVSMEDGSSWKGGVLCYLYPQVIGIVDDNPAVLEHLPKDYRGTIFLFDSEEALQGSLRIIACKTWTDVHTQVRLLQV